MKLEIHSLTKVFGGVAALDHLDLISEAKVLCLIGPSGSGKSTLLRILGGLETADHGKVVINGEPVPTAERALLRYRKMNGFLFQQFNLFPHLTALENLIMPLEKAHGKSSSEALRLAGSVLKRFGLDGHSHKRPAQLSGGQQQRVALARAVAHQPRILFLDEPTSALDPEMTGEVLDLIRELAEEGQNIILSTHEMGFAKAVADRIAFVAAGKVVENTVPSLFFDQPESAEGKRFLLRVMKY